MNCSLEWSENDVGDNLINKTPRTVYQLLMQLSGCLTKNVFDQLPAGDVCVRLELVEKAGHA